MDINQSGNNPASRATREPPFGFSGPPPMFASGLYGSSETQPFQASLPDGLQKIWQTHENFSRARSELEEVLSQRSRTPSVSMRDLQNKDFVIERLREQVAHLEQALHQQEEELDYQNRQIYNQKIKLRQQAQTIQIHSEQLSKHHTRPSQVDTTPCRYPSQYANQSIMAPTSSAYSDPSKTYQSPNRGIAFTPPHNGLRKSTSCHSQMPPGFVDTKWGPVNLSHEFPDTSQSLAQRETRIESPSPLHRGAVNEQGSPLPISQMRSLTLGRDDNRRESNFSPAPSRQLVPLDAAQQATPNTSSGSSRALVPNAHPATPARTDSAMSRPRSLKDATMPYNEGTRQEQMANRYQAFFDIVVDFAYKYVNNPSASRDSQMPKSLKTELLNASSPHTAFPLMSNEQTRYFLVTKILIQWVQNKIFSGNSMLGLDKNIDDTIITMKSNLGRRNPPPPPEAHHVYRKEIARQYGELKNLPNYEQFLSSRCYSKASELWNLVRPLIYQKIDGDWEHMCFLTREAHRLAEMILNDTAEYQMFFPKVHQIFSQRKMINMDIIFRELHPDMIEAQHLQVRLGAIPEVMYRATRPEGTSQPETLIKAGVLLKKAKGTESNWVVK